MDVIHDFLVSRSPVFTELKRTRELGWRNVEGDQHFKVQRERADGANKKQQRIFFDMMRNIGQEMQAATGALILDKQNPQILDTCAAPGGFISIALDYNPSADVYALTLPRQLGGHPLLVRHGRAEPRVQVQFLDITTLGLECGLEPGELRPGMSSDRPYTNVICDLVFCDGQLLRTNREHRDESLEGHAAARLTYSQLIFAMNRLCPGATMIVLLHKPEIESTLRLLATFSEFSTLKLFKPQKCHATRSSFYMVATDIQCDCPAAMSAVEYWRQVWRHVTLNPQIPTDDPERSCEDSDRPISDILDQFGDRFIELAEPIWKIQNAAIQRSAWFRAGAVDRLSSY